MVTNYETEVHTAVTAKSIGRKAKRNEHTGEKVYDTEFPKHGLV